MKQLLVAVILVVCSTACQRNKFDLAGGKSATVKPAVATPGVAQMVAPSEPEADQPQYSYQPNRNRPEGFDPSAPL